MKPPPIPLAPLLLWTLVQLAALAISAGRVPLSAEFPQPAERSALGVLAVTQVTAAALTFPLLLPTLRAAIATATIALGFLGFAGLLGDALPTRTASVGLYLTLWLATLYLLNRRPAEVRTRPVAVALVGLLTLGPPLLGYLRADLSPRPPFGAGLNFFPLPATAALCAANSGRFWPWLGIIFCLSTAAIAALWPKPASR